MRLSVINKPIALKILILIVINIYYDINYFYLSNSELVANIDRNYLANKLIVVKLFSYNLKNYKLQENL